MPQIPKKRFTAVGCHIFAGGFTVGVKRAGFDVLCHLENTDYGVPTARANFPKLPVYVGEENWPLDRLLGKVDFVYCNPPCAPWSMMGPRTTRGSGAWRTDPRLSWWRQAVSLLSSVRPKVWACESVTQIYSSGREFVDEMTREALAAGYSVTHLLLDARWAGVPQARRRFVFLCHLLPSTLGLDFDWRETTVRQVLSTVKDPGYSRPFRPDLGPALRQTPTGGRLVTTWERLNPGFEARLNAQGHVQGRPSFQDCRLPLDGVMGAYVGDKVYHPTEDRLLGIEEAKAVCGYPSDFQLVGRQGPELGSLLARAVMPPVGEWLASAAAETIRLGKVGGRQSVTLVDLRRPPGERRDLTAEYAGAVVPALVVAGHDRRHERPLKTPEKTVMTMPRPHQVGETPFSGEGSGEFIRRLWMAGKYTPEELVQLVLVNWEGRTTKVRDVYYNYRRLLDSGVKGVPPWPSRVKAATMVKVESPAILVQAKKVAGRRGKILLTGSTPMQVGSSRTQMKIITSMEAWFAALTEMGYDVDWRVTLPGEDLSSYTAVVAALNKPGSIASRQFYGALWALYSHPVKLAVMDDWQTREFMTGMKTVSKTLERAFRIFQHVPEKWRPRLYKMLLALRDEPWPWTTVVPIFDGGDASLLGLNRGPVAGVDPTSYVRRYPVTKVSRERRWVQASLLLKDPPVTCWPTEFFGNAGRAMGGLSKSKTREARRRVVESELMVEYCRSWGILSPAHPHSGSGWWRVRYLMSADAGCVLSASDDEAAVLGEPYIRAASSAGIARVESLTDGMLRRWAYDQRQRLAEVAWSKDRVKDSLSNLLRRAEEVK